MTYLINTRRTKVMAVNGNGHYGEIDGIEVAPGRGNLIAINPIGVGGRPIKSGIIDIPADIAVQVGTALLSEARDAKRKDDKNAIVPLLRMPFLVLSIDGSTGPVIGPLVGIRFAPEGFTLKFVSDDDRVHFGDRLNLHNVSIHYRDQNFPIWGVEMWDVDNAESANLQWESEQARIKLSAAIVTSAQPEESFAEKCARLFSVDIQFADVGDNNEFMLEGIVAVKCGKHVATVCQTCNEINVDPWQYVKIPEMDVRR